MSGDIRKKALPSQGFWDESADRFVVPPKFKRTILSFFLLVRGGCRGRFRPRSAAVLLPLPAKTLTADGVFLCMAVYGVLLRRLYGIVSLYSMHFYAKSQELRYEIKISELSSG